MRKWKVLFTAACAATMLFGASLSVSAAEVRDIFDAKYYAQTNPDIGARYGNDEEALYNHFITAGVYEGRSASLMFDAEDYKKAYPDLTPVLGNDPLAYWQHFAASGMAEGRSGGGLFDPAAYGEAYPDLVAVLGNDPAALCKHFSHFGLDEGRTKGLLFSYRCYAAVNPDLERQYGLNEAALFKQYITEGRANGRQGAKASPIYESLICDKVNKHVVTDWDILLRPTCLEPGFEYGSCEICTKVVTSRSEPYDLRGHIDYNDNGYCSVCGEKM